MIQECPTAPSQSTPSSSACWQPEFLEILPLVERHARYFLRHLPRGEARDEALQEVVCNACVAYARLAEQGRAAVANPTSLARYGAAQYRVGCRVGAALNINDVCSTYCQRRKGVQIRSLTRWDEEDCAWKELLVEDRNATPADLAASRIDFAAFMASLSARTRRIAELLAVGETTSRVAELVGVTAGRISQLRRELQSAWDAFHEPRTEAAVA